jgi:hypothetical protein
VWLARMEDNQARLVQQVDNPDHRDIDSEEGVVDVAAVDKHPEKC